MGRKILENVEIGIPVYTFNVELWSNLGAVIGIKNARIQEISHVGRLTLWRWQKKGDARMKELVMICNQLCLRLSSFIAPDSDWTPLGKLVGDGAHTYSWQWHPENLRNKLGTDVSKNEAQRELQCNWYSLERWTSQEASVSQVLYLCNCMRWNLGECLTDPSMKDITSYQSRSDMEREILRLRNQIAQMRIEMNNKNVQINEGDGRGEHPCAHVINHEHL